MALEIIGEDVKKLVEEHNEELIIKKLPSRSETVGIRKHCFSSGKQIGRNMPSSEIKRFLYVWEGLQMIADMNNTDQAEAVASRVCN